MHKILALVLLPCVLALVCAGQLCVLLQENARIVKASDIHQDLTMLQGCVIDAGKAIGKLAVLQDDRFYREYERAVQKFPYCTGQLRKHLAPAPGQKPTTAEQQALDAIDDLSRIEQEVVGTTEQGLQLLRKGERTKEVFDTLRPELKKLNNQVERIQEAAVHVTGDHSPDELFEKQQQMFAMVVTMVITFIVVAIGSAIFAVKNITSRLKVVVANTHRLTAKKPLLPQVGGNDEIAHLDAVFRDMAGALHEAEERERERLRAKQEFMQMISHDLRTPLTSIQLFLNLLSQGSYGDLSTRAQDKARIADNNARRLVQLVTDLLEIERVEAGQLELHPSACEAHDLIERSIDAVRSYAEQQNITLVNGNDVGDTLSATATINPLVYADGDRVIQVLVNLIGNAIKFSQADSTVTVSASLQREQVRFAVTDQGRGIPSRVKDTVFQRFKQVEHTDATVKKGTGLGLAICKAIVDQSNGSIGVDSEEGRGSTFWFLLPAATTAAASEDPGVKIQINDSIRQE